MKNISIEDSTLKLYGKHEPLALTFKEKLDLAKKLCELKVNAIELCHNTSDKADEVLIKTICTCVKDTVISCDVGSDEKSVERVYSLLASAKNKRLVVSVPVSPVQMEYFVSKKPKAVLDTLANLTKKSVSLCDDVEVSLEDATRAEFSFLCEAIKIAIENGAKRISFTDLAGVMLPNEFEKFIANLYESVPELKKVIVGVSCSNELSMAVASILSAVALGVSVIKVSALGDFNLPSISDVARAFDYIGMNKGYGLTVNKTAIKTIVEQIAGISKNKAIVPNKDEVGEKTIAGDLSIEEIEKIITDRGYQVSDEELDKVYNDYLRLASKKSVKMKELDAIVSTSIMQVKETYSLVRYAVNCSNAIDSTASVVLTKDGKKLSGIAFGNGSVDSAFNAIENAIKRHFDLDAFEVDAVTEGGEAVGQTIVKLRNKGKVYSGRGISTDIVGASIRAYINALNMIMAEEE